MRRVSRDGESVVTMMARKVNEIVSAGIAQKMSLQGGDGFHMHPPADETRNGFMTKEDRVLLKSTTSLVTPDSLMQRDGSGRAKVAAPVDTDDIARKYEVDVVNQRLDKIIVDGGNSNPEIVDARGGYPVLGARLDANDAYLDDITLDKNSRGINVKHPPFPLASASGDGTTNETATLQAILDAASDGETIVFPTGTYIINELIVNKTLTISSPAEAVLKFANGLSTSTNMCKIIKNGITVKFENIVFDGNKDSLIAPNDVNKNTYKIISWDLNNNTPTSTINSTLVVKDCNFLNTPSNAIYLTGYKDQGHSGALDSIIFRIDNNHFEKGFENAPGYMDTTVIAISGNCNGSIERNTFIKREPVSLYGLGAITITTADTLVEVFSTVTIRNNYFNGYGRQGATGVGPIGVIDFYASCENLIIEGNRIINSYFAGIKGKTNSRNCIVSNNIISGCTINQNSANKIFGIVIGRGTFFGIYDKYIISGNILRGIYGNGIDLAGAGSTFTPTGNMKDIIVTDNEVDIIPETGTTSYGLFISNADNATIKGNIFRNNTRSIYITNYKKDFVITDNQFYSASTIFIALQGYQTGEGGYTDYDANVIIKGNVMRTTIETTNTSFWVVYVERLSNVIVQGNSVRIEGTTAPQNFLRTGPNMQGIVMANANILKGTSVSAFFGVVSGTLVQSMNYNNGVVVP